MPRCLLALFCVSSALVMACQNGGPKVEISPETRAAAVSSTAPDHPPDRRAADDAILAPSAPAVGTSAATNPTVANGARSDAGRVAPAARVSENADELSRFVQLPVRPTSVLWQSGAMGKNEKPDVPGPSDGFLIAVLSYAPADADRLVAQAGAPARTDVATALWFPAALRALARSDADGREVLSATRYVASSYARAPFSNGALHRIGQSGWFVLVLSTS